jgi:hypothetical protein
MKERGQKWWVCVCVTGKKMEGERIRLRRLSD